MPSKTEKQKKFFGAVMGAKKGQSDVSGEAKKVAKKMPKKEIKKFLKKEGEEDECWKGYEQVGMKKKGNKKVPNCVPKEEDEQSVTKKMKKGGGKATFEGPKVKERKHFAPMSKPHKSKKGKGSYNRKKTFGENTDIVKFIECILTKNYASANKYLNSAVETKLQQKIESELSTPLF